MKSYSYFYSEMRNRNNTQLKKLQSSLLPEVGVVEAPHKLATEVGNSPQSLLADLKCSLIQIEYKLEKTQEFIKNDYSILKQSLNNSLAYHQEIGGTTTDIERVWSYPKKSAKRLEELADQAPLDYEQEKNFNQIADLWEFLLETEIKITTNLHQQIMLRQQERLASCKVEELENTAEVQVLSTITDRKIAAYQMRGSEDPILVELQRVVPDVETKTNPRHLLEIHLDLSQWQEMKKQKQELLQKSQAAYEKLIERAKRTHEELQAASQELERYTQAHRSKQTQLPVS